MQHRHRAARRVNVASFRDRDAGGWLRRVRPWLRAYRRALKASRALSPDPVHEVRVATRHLQVLLGLLRPVLTDRESRSLQRLLDRTFHHLGPVRDCVVVGVLLRDAGLLRIRPSGNNGRSNWRPPREQRRHACGLQTRTA
jgi:CHAD domain-containing protein